MLDVIQEVIGMHDGELKVITFYSNDLNAIDLYFKSRKINEVRYFFINNIEYSMKEADKKMLEYKQLLSTERSNNGRRKRRKRKSSTV